MVLEVRGVVDCSQWDDQLQQLGGGPFHCSAWANYRAAPTGTTPLFFSWRSEGNDPAALALGFETVPPKLSRLRFLRFDSPPVGFAPLPHLMPSLRQWLNDERNIVACSFGSFDARDYWPIGRPVNVRRELLAATGTDDELVGRMRKGARYSIKRAERAGVRCSVDSGVSAAKFVTLYRETLHRLSTTKNLPVPRLNVAALVQQVEGLVDGGAGALFVARLSSEPIAACLFTSFGERPYYLLNGASDAARDTGATAAVLYLALRHFSEKGCSAVNLGGVPEGAVATGHEEHGLYAFKAGLGASDHQCVDSRLVLRPALAGACELGRRVLRRLRV